MSRIGKQLIPIPAEAEVKINGRQVLIKGPRGELVRQLPVQLKLTQNSSNLVVAPSAGLTKSASALWGLWRTLLNNALLGVTKGFKKELELVGIGFRAEKKGDKLVLNLGYSHPVEYQVPAGVAFSVEKTIIKLEGIDKQQVGQTAAQIRAISKPEPYKGKGIRYVGEEVKLKPGKAGKAAGATGG